MLEQPVVRLFENMFGKSLPSMREEATNISAKTWKTGGPKRSRKQQQASKSMESRFVKTLMDGGFSQEEAEERSRQLTALGALGPWGALVGMFVIPGRLDYPETRALALKFDEISERLGLLRQADDLDGFKGVLLQSEVFQECSAWLPEGSERETYLAARDSARAASDWDATQGAVGFAATGALFRFFACWDVEFLAGYLKGAQPRPVFELVMPRLKPGVKPKADSLYPSRGLFRPPLRSLLEVCYCFGIWQRTGKWPAKRKVTRTWIAAEGGAILSGDNSEQPLAKIYKELRNLSAPEFASVWSSFCGLDDQSEGAAPPWPLYVAAQLWSLLLTKKDPRHRIGTTSMTFPAPELYRYWWERSYEKMKARGVWFGDVPWPKCITDGSLT